MMLQYQERCTGKGRGFARNRFDHLTFREKLFAKKQVKRGVKEVMMDWGEFQEHFEKKKFSRSEILAKWQKSLQDGAETDQKGRKGQELRISSEVETYKLEETATGKESSRVLEHSAKKFKGEDVTAIDRDITGQPDNPGSYQPGASQSLPAAVGNGAGGGAANDSDNAPAKAKLPKSAPLSRRVSMHDAALQAVRKAQDSLKKLPSKMRATILAFEPQEAEYEEYMRILRKRLELLTHLAADGDFKNREAVEEAAATSTEALKKYLSCLRQASSVLKKNTHEEIDEWKSSWDDTLSILVQTTALMEQSVKDIAAWLSWQRLYLEAQGGLADLVIIYAWFHNPLNWP